jgi:hypothetical protein
MNSVEVGTLTAAERRRKYRQWIDEGLAYFEKSISQVEGLRPGCFSPPYRLEKAEYRNTRWQEIVFALAWKYIIDGDQSQLSTIKEGILFWTELQNASGSFPQYCRKDSDFAATAFSSYVIAAVLNTIGQEKISSDELWKDKVQRSLSRGGRWLCANNESVYSNQQMAAALALFEISKFLDSPHLEEASEGKLIGLLKKQRDGIFLERGGFDIGYSTLTFELLARYYLRTEKAHLKKLIHVAVECFLESLNRRSNSLSFGTGSRGTDWVVLGGFEVFSGSYEIAKNFLEYFFQTQDVRHLPDSRHVCTDLCRLCFAYDHSVVDLSGMTVVNPKVLYNIQEAEERATLRLLRPFGLHRLRRWI